MIPIDKLNQTHGSSLGLIILCCRAFLGNADIEELNQFIISNPIDWEEFYKICRRQRIQPIAYRIILKTNTPKIVKEKINQDLKIFIGRAYQQAIETERLVLILKQQGIHVIPYKGTVYAKQFFGDISMRASGDIDFIIEPSQLKQAITVIKDDGYLAIEEDFYRYLGHKTYTKLYRAFNFTKKSKHARPLTIELHWKVIDNHFKSPTIDNSFRNNANQSYQLIGTDIESLHTADHFCAIYLHHIFQEDSYTLKHAVDIAQGLSVMNSLKTTYSLDVLEELKQKYKLDFSLILIEHLIGLKFYSHKPPVDQKNIDLIIDEILKPVNNINGTSNLFVKNIEKNIHYIRKRNRYYSRLSEKIVFAIKFLALRFQPSAVEYRAIKLPRNLKFLYWFISPLAVLINPSFREAGIQLEKEKIKIN